MLQLWLCLLVVFAASLSGAVRADEPKTPHQLPYEVIEVWKKAGAEVGWMSTEKLGGEGFRSGLTGRSGELPAFAFREWKANTIAKLPHPDEPFGLDLSLTEVTEQGLKQLTEFKELQGLDLHFTDVTDDGLKHVAACRNLRTLYLSYTKLTGDGMKHLARLKGLKSLDLFGTPVTDGGLKYIAELQSLRGLDLGFTRVTGDGLSHLAKLKELRTLNLFGTMATKASVMELQASLPTCRIYPPQFHEPTPLAATTCYRVVSCPGILSVPSVFARHRRFIRVRGR